jgi:hypothetical protein
MRSRASFMTVTLVLAACLACPLVEMFDQWDDTVHTGDDTEYALVVLAMCVGVAYLIARFIPKLTLPGPVVEALSSSPARLNFPVLKRLHSTVLIPASPPTLRLRV